MGDPGRDHEGPRRPGPHRPLPLSPGSSVRPSAGPPSGQSVAGAGHGPPEPRAEPRPRPGHRDEAVSVLPAVLDLGLPERRSRGTGGGQAGSGSTSGELRQGDLRRASRDVPGLGDARQGPHGLRRRSRWRRARHPHSQLYAEPPQPSAPVRGPHSGSSSQRPGPRSPGADRCGAASQDGEPAEDRPRAAGRGRRRAGLERRAAGGPDHPHRGLRLRRSAAPELRSPFLRRPADRGLQDLTDRSGWEAPGLTAGAPGRRRRGRRQGRQETAHRLPQGGQERALRPKRPTLRGHVRGTGMEPGRMA